MPILLKSEVIKLSPQTENEAKYMVEAGVGKIFMHIKEAKLSYGIINGGSEVLLKIQGDELSLILLGSNESKDELLIRIKIGEDYPHVKINRKNGK